MASSFVFYRSFYEVIKKMPSEEANKLTLAICEYALDNVKPEGLEYPANMAFDLIKPQLDANKRRRDNGKKGGAPKGNQNARKEKPYQKQEWYEPIMQRWNELSQYGISKVIKIKGSKRYDMLQALVKEYGESGIYKAIDNIRESTYLQGQESTSWKIDFDWFVIKENFVKVLEGKYQGTYKSGSKIRPINGFHNFEQRKYDFDQLENKLLKK